MPIVTLRDLYQAELQDLFDAERQAIAALPEMARAATSGEVRDAFSEHLEETHVQLQRLELLLRKLDVAADGRPSETIRALVADARRRIEEVERGDVLDAALIGAAQRIEHYEIAAYGCARSYARTLGDDDAAALLQQTLDEEGSADHRLTRIAERDINRSAADDHVDAGTGGARLRFVPASSLGDFAYRGARVTNAADEDLGILDGLVVDERTRQPVYGVVDSGGWFTGRRFLVPVGLMQADAPSRTLRTDLDRAAVHRYPPFNPEAFDGTDQAPTAPAAASAQYKPPTWLMTGVWMTEGSGFAAVPPTAHAECPPKETYPENELMTARGEPEDRGDKARQPHTEGQPTPERDEPRLERYRER
jgi:ferritin-like metal-binding protein YciE